MTQATDDSDRIQNHVASFAHRLDSYAASLQTRERLILAAVLVRSMDPLDRMRFKDPSSLLEPDEAAILDMLQKEEAEA
jgi:hypothetical protein